ncbi:VOC family protein [Paraburkholderia youngii]|uniref:Glyoxalase n=1 Tax=Paraburkholderia youngii TaxID=2782701 RepID=A0A7Y6K6H4_9BURK|nr:VOC family protein [Paraburkholderia youngii]NUY05187.1 glyoxalase [Paraburkholderia youngii]
MSDAGAEISNLGYVVVGAQDLEAWSRFASDILGLQVKAAPDGNSLTLRMDEYVQRILVQKSDDEDIFEAGWEFETPEKLEAYVERLRGIGQAVERGGPALCGERRVEMLYHCDDPSGFRHAFYTGPHIAPMTDAWHSKVMRGRFETGRLGIGHIVIRSKDLDQSVDFYRKVLGLKLSDYIRAELAPGVKVDVTFMHTTGGRHHSLATGTMPGNKRLGHLMLQVQDMNDVGLAYDRCIAAGLPMLMHLGRHPNDLTFSFYVKSPSGFAVEYGHGGIVVDDATWKVSTHPRLSDWGHKFG